MDDHDLSRRRLLQLGMGDRRLAGRTRGRRRRRGRAGL
jgi:hypothetical protein